MQAWTLNGIAQCDIPGYGDYRNAPPRNCRLHGNLKHPGHLLRVRNQLAIVAALREKMFRMGLLKISASNFTAGNLRGNSKYRHPAAMTIVEPVDQMQIARPATSRANGKFPGKMRLRSGGKRRRFLVPH